MSLFLSKQGKPLFLMKPAAEYDLCQTGTDVFAASEGKLRHIQWPGAGELIAGDNQTKSQDTLPLSTKMIMGSQKRLRQICQIKDFSHSRLGMSCQSELAWADKAAPGCCAIAVVRKLRASLASCSEGVELSFSWMAGSLNRWSESESPVCCSSACWVWVEEAGDCKRAAPRLLEALGLISIAGFLFLRDGGGFRCQAGQGSLWLG